MKNLIIIWLLLCSQVVYAQQAYNPQKLSGYLRNLIAEQNVAQARGQDHDTNTVCTLMKLNANGDVNQVASIHKCQVLDSIGRIYFVLVPVCQLSSLSMEDCMQRIEAHEMPKPTMDEIPEKIGATKAWQGDGFPQAFNGSGVIAGIADIGYDFTHPMFIDNDGYNRICQFINMAEKNDSGGLGKTYSTKELLDLKHSPRAIIQTHGTHVASLMAGSMVQGQKASYSGIAPQCDIILSEVAANYVDSTDNTSGSSVSMLLGIKRMFDYATKVGKPCIANLSMGGWLPITTDVTLENQVISKMTGPGHILVASSGNEGGYPATMRKAEGVNTVAARFYGTMPAWDSISTQFKANNIECWLNTDYNQLLQFHFFNFSFGGGRHIMNTIEIETTFLDSLQDSYIITDSIHEGIATIYASPAKDNSNSNYEKLYEFRISVVPNNSSTAFSNWLWMYGIEVSISSDFPCEMYTNPMYTPFTLSKQDLPIESKECISYEHTVGWPASVTDVIAAGATYRDNSSLASFSSRGPTWDNMVKPDVTAPGVNIRGAYNKFCYTFASDQDNFHDVIPDNNGNNDFVIAYSGTSMSSPIVAGTIALWLQAKPDLSPSDIKDVLAHTSKHINDNHIDGYPNNMYGYGEIDAYAGLLYILGIPNNIDGISMKQPSSFHITLEGRNLIVKDAMTGQPYLGEVLLKVYTVNGKCVAQGHQNIMNLSGFTHGIYVIQIDTKEPSSCGSTLIRL